MMVASRCCTGTNIVVPKIEDTVTVQAKFNVYRHINDLFVLCSAISGSKAYTDGQPGEPVANRCPHLNGTHLSTRLHLPDWRYCYLRASLEKLPF